MVLEINEIRRRLSDIGMDRNVLRIGDLGVSADEDGTRKRMTQTSSLLMETEVFGREKEKEEILEYLLASDDGPSSIAITGMGGLGKTTLAQLVYNDGRVKEHFNLKMWVWMTVDYDVVNLTREILGSADYDLRLLWGIQNLDVYQRTLMGKLKGKRFLLVIDNLWDRDQRKWQSLCAPLVYGEKGSKILITTRDTKVANILQTGKTLKLEGLQFHDCWMLFKKHAFADGVSGEYPRLEAIGKQIVEKFKGVPLAALAVGGLLYSELDESEWIRILEGEIWGLEHGEDGVLSVLKLSYEHLSPQLKQCFTYCSLFPKNHWFDKLELVQQWMAHAFVQTGGRGRMEDVGTAYFDDLLHRSFFQHVDGKYSLHDLIHDLAMLVSQDDHSIIDNNASHNILEDGHTPHHLSLLMTRGQVDEIDFRRLYSHRSLRTLIFFFPKNISFQIPHNIFLILYTLRVLDLSCGGIEMLPDSIDNLIHLRYLDLRRNGFRRLPESLCHLYKLQTLKLRGCRHIVKLPQGISNLINLRHLDVEPHLLSGIVGIGKLTSLQELESFPISQGEGTKIDDLKDMNELRGGLSIRHLHWVRSKEEAAQAMLHNKQHLHKLKMEWDQDRFAECGHSNLEQVLEALVPPANLKELILKGYDGVRCPSWMDNRLISKLESLCLSSCKNLSSLPLLWCLPYLKRIEIVDCPQLKNLPCLSTTARELTIENVGLEELPEFCHPHQLTAGVICNDVIPSLSILRIKGCPGLRSLQQGLLRHYLRNLTVLSIQDCTQLVHWPEGAGFQATLLSLRVELLIKDCPKLTALPAGSTLSASLGKLTLTGCPGVVNGPLFAQLYHLRSESMVYVRKAYENFACCSEEALQNLRTLDWLQISEAKMEEPCEPRLVTFVCDTARIWSWKSDDWVVAWRVQIYRSTSILFWHSMLLHSSSVVPPEAWWQRRSPGRRRRKIFSRASSRLTKEHLGLGDHPPILDLLGDRQDDTSTSEFLGDRHLDHLPWASSIRWVALVADGIWHGALPPFNLASLEGLWISCFGGSRPLLTDSVLCHLTGLKELQIFDCPELTMSSLQEVIQSLPSLQHLTIEACPELSSSPFSCSHSSTSPSNAAATLQTLFVDDLNLLCDAQFVRDQLNSLQGLHIWYASIASFTAASTGGVRSLGRSLRHLSIRCCSNLKHLPEDLWSLLPSLRALGIGNCPELRCLPEGPLPALLEILVIHYCPVLQGQKGQQHQQHKDWPKVAHIPVIVSDGDLVQGSYREFLEMRDKWRDF